MSPGSSVDGALLVTDGCGWGTSSSTLAHEVPRFWLMSDCTPVRSAQLVSVWVGLQITTGAPVLRIELPESEAANLKQGESIRFLADDSEEPRFATIRQVYPAVSSGRVMADIDASGIDRQLVGGRVRVMAPAGERVAIVIPDAYIDTRYGADYARLSRKGGIVIEVPVQRGSRVPLEDMPDGVEILSGLRAGDVILPVERAS